MKVNIIYSEDGKEVALQAIYKGKTYTGSPMPNRYIIDNKLKERFARGIINSIQLK